MTVRASGRARGPASAHDLEDEGPRQGARVVDRQRNRLEALRARLLRIECLRPEAFVVLADDEELGAEARREVEDLALTLVRQRERMNVVLRRDPDREVRDDGRAICRKRAAGLGKGTGVRVVSGGEVDSGGSL